MEAASIDDSEVLPNNMQEEQSEADNAVVVAKEPPILLWQSTVRESISPYLPPPVISAMQRADIELEEYVGPEGSVTILSSLLLGWLVLAVVRLLSLRLFGSGRALADEETILEKKSATSETYDATVVFVGPPGGGKTRLFYRLCHGEAQVPTLCSLRANVGISTTTSDNNGQKIRYMDWPGYASLHDEALESVFAAPNTRVVLVLDATQPVAAAADTLHHLFSLQQQSKSSKMMHIFVACHKTDLPKAKNWRRIKIQLRTELERLLTVSAKTNQESWWSPGKPLELDGIDGVKLYFFSTSAEGGRLSPELTAFCQMGEVPEEAK